MPVNLAPLPVLHPVAGIRLGVTAAGIRKPGRLDLTVIECAPGTQVAAVFTRNRFCAAPVHVAREHLGLTRPRALVINTGCANAGTGAQGLGDARACCADLARRLGCLPQEVLPFSTGVIGERLPVERLTAGLPACLEALDADSWAQAARGILTTDTVPKGSSRRLTAAAGPYTLTGVAKGAGMIRPDMATLLAFLATDAEVPGTALQEALARAVGRSFNRITVDGDTSTNDAVLLLATGRSGAVLDPAARDPAATADWSTFESTLEALCAELAQAIVRDAEGATKFITVEVAGAANEEDALRVAYAVAHSPLVKTAFYASDPNWGRILAAVGRAGAGRLEIGRVSVHLNEVCVVQDGGRAPDYREQDGARVMAQPEISVRIGLGVGQAGTRVWTCDLSHEYVTINAEYRT